MNIYNFVYLVYAYEQNTPHKPEYRYIYIYINQDLFYNLWTSSSKNIHLTHQGWSANMNIDDEAACSGRSDEQKTCMSGMGVDLHASSLDNVKQIMRRLRIKMQKECNYEK